MRVVIDTNVLLMSIPTVSRYRPIFQGLINGDFELALSNEILSEYVEVIQNRASTAVAKNIAELLLNRENVIQVEPFYRWNLITEDYDDNKFVDCAVAASAKHIVSNDKHLRVLKNVDFPPTDVVLADTFLDMLRHP